MLISPGRIPKLYVDILSLDVTKLAKFVAECFEQAWLQVLGKNTNKLRRPLLRARRNRACD